MGAIKDFLANGGHPTPSPPEPPVVVPIGEQEGWMRMIERFQKLQAPEFHGGSDPLTANRWKEDMGNILDLMGMKPIQRQKLAAFSLKGYASKLYKTKFSSEERLTTI